MALRAPDRAINLSLASYPRGGLGMRLLAASIPTFSTPREQNSNEVVGDGEVSYLPSHLPHTSYIIHPHHHLIHDILVIIVVIIHFEKKFWLVQENTHILQLNVFEFENDVICCNFYTVGIFLMTNISLHRCVLTFSNWCFIVFPFLASGVWLCFY